MKPTSSELSAALKIFIDTTDLAGLTPGARAGTKAADQLNAELGGLLKTVRLSPRATELLRGTVLLWHDHLDAAHEIAQAIEDADGSLLHAIMHRREPDFGNSKYWFRRVGQHPVYEAIAVAVPEVLGEGESDLMRKLLPGGTWDPYAFVDACEAAHRRRADAAVLKQIQKIEFTAFLSYLT